MSKIEDFRERIAQAFIDSLKEDALKWRKTWSFTSKDRPYNAASGNQYKGLNVLWLSYTAEKNDYADPRWATFKQAQDRGWRIKAGAKGANIEYWMPFDNEKKKIVTWDEYNETTDQGKKASTYKTESGTELEKYSIRSKLFTVFNGDQIEGIPILNDITLNHEIKKSDVVDRVSQGMGVKIVEKNQNKAYYNPVTDQIRLPLRGQFESNNAYQSTALHELGHATGHPDRIGRDLSGSFGKESYAYEELVAEISSVFMGEYFDIEPSEAEMDNHKAYIQSWMKEIKSDKNYLFRAIKQAEEAADYMIEKGELNILRDESYSRHLKNQELNKFEF